MTDAVTEIDAVRGAIHVDVSQKRAVVTEVDVAGAASALAKAFSHFLGKSLTSRWSCTHSPSGHRRGRQEGRAACSGREE
jgi:hypothetical protein